MENQNATKKPERKVKSVNFIDESLFEFATRRSNDQFSGNFSSYILSLVRRDKSGELPEEQEFTSIFYATVKSKS